METERLDKSTSSIVYLCLKSGWFLYRNNELWDSVVKSITTVILANKWKTIKYNKCGYVAKKK